MINKKNRISFCIICMNRLHQLKQTLLQNITANAGYTDLEFVVLNYNSADDMENWIRENMHEHITTGRMVYYFTPTPAYFSHSHAKNMAFRLASGNIVCNINADHYTGTQFAGYVNEAFTADDTIVLTPIDFFRIKNRFSPPRDVLGKVCVKKSDFLAVRGFDEQMNQYGFEDYDFINRLEMTGVKRVLIENELFLQFISHNEEERFSLPVNDLAGIYLHSGPSVCDLVILYKNGRFKKGRLIDNYTYGAEDYMNAFQPKKYLYQFTVQPPGLTEGTWKEHDACIDLNGNNGPTCLLHRERNGVLKDDDGRISYTLTNNQQLIEGIARFIYFFHNRSIMEKNLEMKRALANDAGFGTGVVYKNFSTQPIYL